MELSNLGKYSGEPCNFVEMAGGEDLPRDAKIVISLLKSMGVEDYEPCVIHQFLELWYHYVVDVLADAQVYSEHASKTAIDCDDVILAIQSRVNFSFSKPPPREVLLELAVNRNRAPLPKSALGPGVALPPDKDTLISPNYQLAIPNKGSNQEAEETEDEETSDTNLIDDQYSDISRTKVSFPLTKLPN